MLAAEQIRQTQPAPAGQLVVPDVWIDNAFQRRLAAVFERAIEQRTKHVIGAVSGAGKTTGLDALGRRHPVTKQPDGVTRTDVIAAVSTDEHERSQSALIRRLIRPLGESPRLPVAGLEDWLLFQVQELGVRLLVFDDAQDFGLPDLRRIKKFGDRLQLEFGHDVGLILLVASQGSAIPLRDLLVQAPNDTFRQFRRRFSRESPWIYVPALSEDEVPEVLAAYEEVLRPQIDVSIEPWSARIYRHLVTPYFDPYETGRVTMHNVENIVLSVGRRLQERGGGRVMASLIDEVAEALAIGTDVITAEVELVTG